MYAFRTASVGPSARGAVTLRPCSRHSHLATAPGWGARNVVRRAAEGDAAVASGAESTETPAAPRDDDVLPDNLAQALQHAAQATKLALDSGRIRCLVEILLPAFWETTTGAIFTEDGDQQRFWKLNRRIVENIMEQTACEKVRVMLPDMGVCAMLRNQWGTEVGFSMASFVDRNPFPAGEELDLVVFASPDPLNSDQCIKFANKLEEMGVPVVMFNPRLASPEAGVGLVYRRALIKFLQTFQTCYSLCPVGDQGSVFRRFPGQWQVFLEEEGNPGRYNLIKEMPNRPSSEELDFLVFDQATAAQEGQEGDNLLATIGSTFTSLQRFMRSLQGM